jgi:hypothetical protein
MHRLVLTLLACLALAACGGPVKRVWPPQASLQEAAVPEDGPWRFTLRLQNFSTVAMRFDEVDLGLSIAGLEAGRLSVRPAVTVGPSSAELVEVSLSPSPSIRQTLASALGNGRGVRYRLDGRVVSGDPRASYDIEFESALAAVPGLPGILR